MKRNDVVQQIRSLKGAGHAANPDTAWVASTRSRLLQHINRTTEEIPTRILTLNHLWSALSLIMPQRTVYKVVRPAFIFVMCFTLGTAGWITTVTASLESLPGDALYPVKIATEQTQVAVTEAIKGEAASTELRLSFATRRADEVNKIITTPSGSEAEQKARVEVAVQNLKSEVETVSVRLQEVKQENPAAAAQVAQVIDRKVEVLQQSLGVTGGQSSSTAAVAIAQLRLEVDRVKTDVSSSTTTSTPSVAASSSTAPIAVKESPAGATTTTITVVAPVNTTSSVTIIITQPEVRVPAKPVPAPEELPPVVVDPQKDFPERPPELAPEVVDEPTPIGIQTWN